MKRPTIAIKRLSECVSHDACDAEQCAYFGTYEELRAVLAWVEELEKEKAEMKAQIKELKAEMAEIYRNPGEWLAGL